MLRTVRRYAPRLALAFAASASLPSTVLHGQQVELRLKHEVGAELVYRTTTISNVTGAMMTQSQTMTVVARQRVVSVADDGSVVMSVTTESLKMNIDGPLGRLDYDSESGVMPTGPMAGLATTLAERVGKPMEIRFDKDGRMLSMEGMPGMEGAGNLGLPTGPVSVGAEWEREANVTLPAELSMSMSMRNHYRLREITEQGGRRVAVIDVAMKGTMATDPNTPAGAMLGSLPLDSTGEIYFDIERGIAIRSVQRQTMTMSLMGESMKTSSENITELLPGPGR